MSVDVADDLHAAEDLAGRAALALEELRAAVLAQQGADVMTTDGVRLHRALSAAAAVVGDWNDYCRPGCQAEGNPESEECLDDTCGCPCSHTEQGPDWPSPAGGEGP